MCIYAHTTIQIHTCVCIHSDTCFCNCIRACVSPELRWSSSGAEFSRDMLRSGKGLNDRLIPRSSKYAEILTLGPNVYSQELLWATWSPRDVGQAKPTQTNTDY